MFGRAIIQVTGHRKRRDKSLFKFDEKRGDMSQMTTVASDEARAMRMRDLAASDEIAAAKSLAERKNKDFTQVYSKGWARLQSLMKDHPAAARLYAFFAEHVDGVTGTVVASQEYLSQALGVHVITIRRNTKLLEDLGALVRIRVGSGVYGYALDPEEIWKSWDNRKDEAVFVTRTLVSKRDRHNQSVAKRLKTLYVENGKE